MLPAKEMGTKFRTKVSHQLRTDTLSAGDFTLSRGHAQLVLLHNIHCLRQSGELTVDLSLA